jgi:hypothetical protein
MPFSSIIVSTLAERARRRDISRWQKAVDMLELRNYLRLHGRPHSYRVLASLTGVARVTISEQITIASAVTPDVLEAAGVTPEQIMFLTHSTLLRIAEMPPPQRRWALWDTVHGDRALQQGVAGGQDRATGMDSIPPHRADVALCRSERRDLSPEEAGSQLRTLIPRVALLAEVVTGATRSHYIVRTQQGGYVIYLAPGAG